MDLRNLGTSCEVLNHVHVLKGSLLSSKGIEICKCATLSTGKTRKLCPNGGNLHEYLENDAERACRKNV